MTWVLVALATLSTAAGCRGARIPGGAGAASGNDRGKASDGPVAVLGGRPVSKADLADYWFERYPEEYGRTLDALLDERLVIDAAHRLGIRVPAEELQKAVNKEVEARRKQIRSMYGDDVDLGTELRRAYGVTVATWRTKVLAPRLHVRLLLERVIRWDTHSRERVHARVIVLEDAARAQRITDKIRRGADFSLTALKESKDPSGKRGGNLPLIGRGDLAFPGVEERLFRASKGSLIGPLEVRVRGKPQWQIYRIVERKPAWEGGYESNWKRLEKDLAERPISGPEFERWRARVRRDGAVRYYRPDGRLWTPPSGR